MKNNQIYICTNMKLHDSLFVYTAHAWHENAMCVAYIKEHKGGEQP
jgi:hypothetical protein